MGRAAGTGEVLRDAELQVWPRLLVQRLVVVAVDAVREPGGCLFGLFVFEELCLCLGGGWKR